MKIFRMVAVAGLLAVAAPSVMVGSVIAAPTAVTASKYEYNRTRVLRLTTSYTDSYDCGWSCVNVSQFWNDGKATLATAAGPYLNTALATPKKSKVTPKASANGISLSATLGTSSGIGATAGGGSCNAGTWETSTASVTVNLWGTWCKVSGLGIWGVTISASGGTLYGSTWSVFNT